MKLFLLILSLTVYKVTFCQENIFGTYELKSSMQDYKSYGTILTLNCDYTYTVSDSLSKHWGTWKLEKNETLILHIDTMTAHGKIEKYNTDVYYKIVNGQFFLAEKEYSKKSYKADISQGNESLKANNIPARLHYTEEGYQQWRKESISLYFEKILAFLCK
ncbi:MAG: hypothetical protein JST86_13075 [Bacteroidetes bacterium]|nr:hypothetical protein [Bacteroidota bacterium]